MTADSLTNPTSESVEAIVTEIARQRAKLVQSRSFAAIREAARDLGLHRVAPKQVLVGGTNGKGSTVRYLQQILSHQGLRVGTTTSPHLHSYLERIMLDREMVTASQCFDAISTVAETTRDLALTYFDLTTLAALHLFKRWEVDVAVVEVGLGGRLDCANVVDSDVAVITNIDVDHSSVLGSTIEEISREKLPIARPNKPLVFADRRTNLVVDEYTQTHDNPLYKIDREFGSSSTDSIFVTASDGRRFYLSPTLIDYAIESFSTALQVAMLLDHLPNELALGTLRFSTLQGRLESVFTRDRHWILDVAHNPAAIHFLRQHLARQNITQCVVVFTCFADKDVRGMLESLVEPSEWGATTVLGVVLTDSYGMRGLNAVDLTAKATGLDCMLHIESNLNDALSVGAKLAPEDTPVVVLGSFDVVSRARCALNMYGSGNRDQ